MNYAGFSLDQDIRKTKFCLQKMQIIKKWGQAIANTYMRAINKPTPIVGVGHQKCHLT